MAVLTWRTALGEMEVRKPFLLQIHGADEEMFWMFADEDTKCDLIDGVLYVHSPASRRHERLFWFLITLMGTFAQRKGLGEVLGSRFTMSPAPGRKFEPDILFVRRENMDRLKEAELEGPADLVVEILSESTRNFDLNEKRPRYREAGVREIWLIDPIERKVIVDRLTEHGYEEEVVGRGRVESKVLEGFWVEADWLFGEEPPDALACLERILGG